jgi:hypothetical protein
MAGRRLGVGDTSNVATVLGGLASIAAEHPVGLKPASRTIDHVCEALNEFSECVRYLNTRRTEGAVLALESEADVQDALYLILRSWVVDLVPESPTDKTGNRYVIRDFVSRSLRLVIEAKYIRDAEHGKRVSKELHDDIEMYRHHPHCGHILFFIYDPNALIPDQRELRRTIEQSRTYDGCPLVCKLIVKP